MEETAYQQAKTQHLLNVLLPHVTSATRTHTFSMDPSMSPFYRAFDNVRLLGNDVFEITWNSRSEKQKKSNDVVVRCETQVTVTESESSSHINLPKQIRPMSYCKTTLKKIPFFPFRLLACFVVDSEKNHVILIQCAATEAFIDKTTDAPSLHLSPTGFSIDCNRAIIAVM